MRGTEKRPVKLFSNISLEKRVRKNVSPRPIRERVHTALTILSDDVSALNSEISRPLIVPEMLLNSPAPLLSVPAGVAMTLNMPSHKPENTNRRFSTIEMVSPSPPRARHPIRVISTSGFTSAPITPPAPPCYYQQPGTEALSRADPGAVSG